MQLYVHTIGLNVQKHQCSSMDDFIRKHISIVNKNTRVTIDLGTAVTSNIFNKQVPKASAEAFLTNCFRQKLLRKTSISHKSLYKHQNRVYEFTNGKLSKLYTYKTCDSAQVPLTSGFSANMTLQKIQQITNQVSHFQYHSVEHCECLEVALNYSTLYVLSFPSFTTCTVILTKPNKTELIVQELQLLLHAFCNP